MKNLKRLLIALAVIVIVVSALAITSTAVIFNGTLENLQGHIDTAKNETDVSGKLSVLDKDIRVYLLNKPIDPLTDGFDEVMTQYDDVVAEIIYGYLDLLEAYPIEPGATLTTLSTNGQKRLTIITELYKVLNKIKIVKFYYAPEQGGGLEPIENRYGSSFFYFNESDVAIEARGALSKAVLTTVTDGLLPVIQSEAEKNNSLSNEFIQTYFEMKKAEGVAKTDLKNTLVTSAPGLVTANSTFRQLANQLHVFLRDCSIDVTLLKPSTKQMYKTLTNAMIEIEYIEIKAAAATYFAYDYDANTTNKHTNLNAAADRLSVYVKNYGSNNYTAEEDYSDIMALVDDVKLDIVAKNEQKKKEIEYDAPMSEYGLLDAQVNNDIQDGKFSYALQNGNATPAGAGNGSVINVVGDPDGNKYAEFTLGKAAGEDGISATQSSQVAYVDIKLGNTTNGYIMEFDVMTKSDSFLGMQLHTAEWADNGARVYKTFLHVSNGAIVPEDGTGKGYFSGAFTPNEWTHITFCYNPDDGQGKSVVTVYVDYEWIGFWWSAEEAQGRSYKLTTLRLTPNANHYTFCLDNLHFYQGTAPREVSRFENLDDVGAYKYYTSVYTNPNYSPQNRDYALNQADLLNDRVQDSPEIKGKKLEIDIYNSETGGYDKQSLAYAEILNMYMENRQTYILDAAIRQTKDKLLQSIGDLFETSVTTSNLSKMSSQVNTISNFISNNSAYIPLDDPEVVSIRKELNRVKKDIARIENLFNLISALEKFDRATTCASMTKRMNEVNQLYKTCELYDSSIYEMLSNDPALQKYESTLDYPQSNAKLITHIENMQSRIDGQRIIENSQKIINCVKIITSLNGYEATDEFLSENEEFIEQYISSIRNVLRSEAYDPTYEGVAEAISKYEEIYPYFYLRMQEEHALAISEKLDIYKSTDSFITKVGACAFIENYLNSNDIDLSNDAIAPLIELYEVYKQEVESQEDNYIASIEQNTETFINLVKKMQVATSYKDLKSLSEEAALALCLMNISSDEAKAAIAIYDEFVLALEEKEAACEIFVEEAIKLKYVKNNKDMYATLVKCSQYMEFVDEEVRGVKTALETYNQKLAEYNAKADAADAMISEAGDVVVSVRTVSIHSAILEIIRNLFFK